MNKKILAVLTILALSVPSTSYANIKNRDIQIPTLAILDTALDTSIPSIKEKLIYEVCILEWNTCPNGSSFMEGPGSSYLPLNLITKNGFDHGTKMTSAAISSNPNMNILFVRIIGQNINGDRQISNEQTIYNALNWVYLNKDKFNIQAVSMSQGITSTSNSVDYCTKTPITESKIKLLVDSNVPVFFPTGNSRDYKRIDWPACIPGSMAIGAGTKNGIELYSNYDVNLIDFHSNGNMKVIAPGNIAINAAGTSISTQVAAANWIALKQYRNTYTLNQIYDLIIKTSRPISGKQGTGKLFELARAISG